jgi:long-chain acyl-CoA synthetase
MTGRALNEKATVAAEDVLGEEHYRTFPQLLEIRARTTPQQTGICEQYRGIWREWSWAAIWEECANLGEGLLALGINPGDRVAFMGDPCLEGLLMSVAAQGVGAVPFGIYPTTPPEQVRYLLDDAGAACFIAEDQEFIDKAMAGGIPEHTRVLAVADKYGMFADEYAEVVTWRSLLDSGADRREENPGDWSERVAAGSPDDLSGIFYTSGTTGQPKGVMLTHANFLSSWIPSFRDEGQLPRPSSRDRTFHDIPVASLAGPLFGLYLPLAFGVVGHVYDKHESPEEAFVFAAPTLYLGFPRMWEIRASRALVAIETSSWIHRFAFAVATRMRQFGDPTKGRRVGPLRRLISAVAYVCVIRQMLDQWGLIHLRYALSGGAPLSPDLVRLWRIWGVTIRQLYGLTEVGGLATLQISANPRPGEAGLPVPAVECRIADDGEILMRGSGVCRGYWGQLDATRDTIDSEGWLHSGDLGVLLESGDLEVIDRKRDVLYMKSGEQVPASSIEHVLKFSPYVRDALLVGEGRPFLAALIEIDVESVAQWARKHSVSYTGYTNLATNVAVVELIESELDKANQLLEERGSQRVEGVRILPKELDPEDPTEITATRKIRRRQLATKFDELVQDIYRTADSERIARAARSATA